MNTNNLFRVTTLGLGAILVLLVVLNLLSGPRLRNVSLDSTKVTTQTGQQIIMHANQPLAKIEQSSAHIDPATSFSVANTADTITLNLKQRLLYDTSYNITIHGVTSANRSGKKSDFTYQFQTADPDIFYLKRAGKFTDNAGHADQIFKTTLHDADPQVVFSAPKIIDYTVLGDSHLIVSSTDATGTNGKLTAVDLGKHTTSDIKHPGSGIAKQLHASSNGSTYGFTFFSTDPEIQPTSNFYNTLFVGDIRPGFRAVTGSGIDGKPINVIDWRFAPDGTSIIAHLTDLTLLLIDGNFKHKTVPLGSVSSIFNFSADGTKLLVDSFDGFATLDLVRHNLQPVPDSQVVSGQDTLLGMLLLPTAGGYLRHYQKTSLNRTTFSDSLRFDKGDSKQTIYNTAKQKTDIQDFDATPNSQFMIIETSKDNDDNYDGYPDAARPLSTHTQIIDIVSGKVIDEINGIKVMYP